MSKICQLSLLFVLALSACGKSNSQKIADAMQVLDERPDSAYVLLKEVDYNKLRSDKDRADYALSHAYANLNMGRSLVTDTTLLKAIEYYDSISDSISYIAAYIAQAYHLRSLERYDEAYALLDSISGLSKISTNKLKEINHVLLDFTFRDKDFIKSLSIIERQIAISDNETERFNLEINKITPLFSLGRSEEAVLLCDSLFSTPVAPPIGSPEWIYMRLNYAAALGERSVTTPKAVAVLEDVINKVGNAPSHQLLDLYIPMIHLQISSKNRAEALRYLALIEQLDIDISSTDPVAASYLDLLRIVMDYDQQGSLSLSRLTNIAQSFRVVNTNLEVKRQERDDALESAYDLSRYNYELTIKQQRMWLIIILIILSAIIVTTATALISHRRRQRLILAEEQIDTLEELVKSANNPATDQKLALLKRLLLQQLGIIKTFVEVPTFQNQDALRRISNIGNSDTPIDSLIKWDDLYPVIDELFEAFHSKLLDKYPGIFSEREIQILCLIRAGFSTKEVAVLVQQTSNSIYVSKTSIRKKLGVEQKEDFIYYLSSKFNAEKAV